MTNQKLNSVRIVVLRVALLSCLAMMCFSVSAQNTVRVYGLDGGYYEMGSIGFGIEHDDLYLAAYDNTGMWLWQNNIEGTNLQAISLGLQDDALYVYGSFTGRVTFPHQTQFEVDGFSLFGQGYRSLFCARLDRKGQYTWVSSLTAPSKLSGHQLTFIEGKLYALFTDHVAELYTLFLPNYPAEDWELYLAGYQGEIITHNGYLISETGGPAEARPAGSTGDPNGGISNPPSLSE